MYEFDSVSVSSFEAGSLTATLTERSADGWDVVAIVTAGSDVVAYLKRSTTTAESIDDTADPSIAGTAADTAAAGTASDLLTKSDAAPSAVAPAGDAGGTGWAASGASSAPAAATGWGTESPAAQSEPAAAGSWGSSSTGSSGATGSSGSSWGGSSQQAAATQPASTPQVPAGWYADPAGRFELRYWDGGAWTEHVSRSGQQYTDPPVA